MGKRIAVTGGIGSGKTTVLQCIEEAGYAVFSCDDIYRGLIDNKEYIEKIKAAFPTAVKNGRIDKGKLGDIVFCDEAARERLNSIAHPLIMQELKKEMDECDSALCFAEVPLLFEGGYENMFDGVVVVKREKSGRLESVMKRDGLTMERVQNRIRSQFDYDSDEAKAIFERANVFVVENIGTKGELKNKLKSVFAKFQE